MRTILAIILVLAVAASLWFASPVSQAETNFEGGYGYGYSIPEPRIIIPAIPLSPVGTYHYGDNLSQYAIFPVADTGSMEPVMNGTSYLLASKETPVIGDIAIYKVGELEVVHRIIGETANGQWIFQGDAVNGTEFVDKSAVTWRVKGILY